MSEYNRVANRVHGLLPAIVMGSILVGGVAGYGTSELDRSASVRGARASQERVQRTFETAIRILQGDENRLELAKGKTEVTVADDKRDLSRLISATGALMLADDHEGKVAGTPNLAFQARLEAADEFSAIAQANATVVFQAQAAHR